MERKNEFDVIDELYNFEEDDRPSEKQIENQKKFAEKIKNNRLSEWHEQALCYVEEEVANKIFAENGLVSKFLSAFSDEGFLFDPETLEAGIDALLSAVKASRNGDDEGATKVYLEFSDAMQRISYLGAILDEFKIYHSIEKAVLADLDENAKMWNMPAASIAVARRKKEIKKLAECEREELSDLKGKQLS